MKIHYSLKKCAVAGLCLTVLLALSGCGSASTENVHLDSIVAKPVLLKHAPEAPSEVPDDQSEDLPEPTVDETIPEEDEPIGSGSRKSNTSHGSASGNSGSYGNSSSSSGSSGSSTGSAGQQEPTGSGSGSSDENNNSSSGSGESGSSSSSSGNSSSNETPPETTCPPLPEIGDRTENNLDIPEPTRPSNPSASSSSSTDSGAVSGTTYDSASADDVSVSFSTGTDIDPVQPSEN